MYETSIQKIICRSLKSHKTIPLVTPEIHFSYCVQGGFRLEVLDPKERPIRDLTPKTGEDEFLRGDPTALNYAAQLPADLECVNCTIRQVDCLLMPSCFVADWSEHI